MTAAMGEGCMAMTPVCDAHFSMVRCEEVKLPCRICFLELLHQLVVAEKEAYKQMRQLESMEPPLTPEEEEEWDTAWTNQRKAYAALHAAVTPP